MIKRFVICLCLGLGAPIAAQAQRPAGVRPATPAIGGYMAIPPLGGGLASAPTLSPSLSGPITPYSIPQASVPPAVATAPVLACSVDGSSAPTCPTGRVFRCPEDPRCGPPPENKAPSPQD